TCTFQLTIISASTRLPCGSAACASNSAGPTDEHHRCRSPADVGCAAATHRMDGADSGTTRRQSGSGSRATPTAAKLAAAATRTARRSVRRSRLARDGVDDPDIADVVEGTVGLPLARVLLIHAMAFGQLRHALAQLPNPPKLLFQERVAHGSHLQPSGQSSESCANPSSAAST